MIRKQREEARLKKEAEQREREAKLQEEQRRRIAFEQEKARENMSKSRNRRCHLMILPYLTLLKHNPSLGPGSGKPLSDT